MALLLKPLLKAMSAGVPFTIAGLYGAGEQGVWYDPSDTTTLFQDSAGTIPVTASGQPVGLMLDKSKGLVLGPELFAAGVASSGITVSGTTVTFDGTHADFAGIGITGSLAIGSVYELTYTVTRTAGNYRIRQATASGAFVADSGPIKRTHRADRTNELILQTDGAPNKFIGAIELSIRELPGNHATQPTAASRPIYRRGDSRGVVNLLLNTETLATQSRTVTAVRHTLSFTGTGSITLSGASTAGPLVGTGVNDRVSLTFTPTAGSLTLTVSGSVTKGQLNLGPTALPYQRNNSHLGGVATGASTDLHWLETDGVDDGMVTGSIDFTGTDKVSVFAGVRKLSDAGQSVVVDLSTSPGLTFATFTLQAPGPSDVKYRFASIGGSNPNGFADTSNTAYSAPHAAVITGVGDIAANTQRVRVNGVDAGTNNNNQGSGNFGKHPLYLFRRGGSSLPFNGWFYGLAITGRLTTDAETVATERFLAAKSAVVIP